MSFEEDESEADWKANEEAFQDHFGIEYDEFTELILALPPSLAATYERTNKVNEEAAILWAIEQGKQRGLIKDAE